MEWLERTIGWGADEEGQINKRIQISGNTELDASVTYEHKLYNATGSIEAQARIDAYIIPCMVCKVFGEPFQGNHMRNKIPGYMWKEMTRRTDAMDVLQYHTLPDLGIYIRSRIVSQSAWIPTYQSSHAPLESGQLYSGGGKYCASRTSVILCTTACSHSCCSVTAPQARTDASMDQTGVVDASISIPSSCTSVGCLHGSIISLLLGSVIPMCRRSSQCRYTIITFQYVSFPIPFQYVCLPICMPDPSRALTRVAGGYTRPIHRSGLLYRAAP